MVAMAATETGVVMKGFSRRIHEGRVMTRDTIFRAATPNSATVITSGRRAYSKPYIIRTSLYSIIR